MSHLRYVHPTEFMYDVQRGIYPGKTVVKILGANYDVDAAAEDFIPWGGLYVFQNAAVAMEVISTSASDDGSPVGIGARTVTVYGLNGSFAEISETVTMNGTTAVPLVNTYRRINRFEVATVGSSSVAVGTIDCRVVAGAVIQARIIAGEGNSRTGVYTVPAAKIAYLESITVSHKRVSNENIDALILSRDLSATDKPITIKGCQSLVSQGTSLATRKLDYGRLVGPCDVWMRAQLASGNNNGIYGTLELVQEDA